VPSLLIPIFYELVELPGHVTPVVWSGVFGWFQILCSRVPRYFRGVWLCLFYFNGEFDPGSG
jgi:hypothetical protein